MQKPTLIKDFGKLEETLKQQIRDVYSKEDKICLKVHMGEVENKYYIKAPVIKRIVSVLLGLGLKPFLFDSPVVYEGGRDSVEKYYKTAAAHGFTEEMIGCPIVISDDFVTVKTKHLDVQVCKPISESDGVLIVSHVKGHPCAGFGAAIKNLGMGCVTKKSKADIHNGAKPLLTGECIACGICARNCPAQCIVIEDIAKIDLDSCRGCSTCVINCPKKALKNKVGYFDELLAEGAFAALSKMKNKFFVNFLVDIAKLCDCCDDAGGIVAPDIGILFGKDILAIDKASLDLINEKKGDVFKILHHHDPYLQIEYGKKLGMGEEEYDIS